MFAQPFCSSNGVSSAHKPPVSCSSSCGTGTATAALAGSPYLDFTGMNAAQGATKDVYVTVTETDGERYVLNANEVFRT